jgi:predicted regulator of amino acid metabolism with ACT domain
MGGVDTVMPDKIVKRVINEILEKAGYESVVEDMKFVKKAEEVASTCGYRPIELCWMTWLVQPEGKIMKMKKYSNILSKI